MDAGSWLIGRRAVLFLSQFQNGRPVASLGPIGGPEGRDGAVISEMLAHGLAQPAGPVAVDDAQARGARKERLVERVLDRLERLVDALPDDD